LPELDGICLPRLTNIDYDELIKQINSVLSTDGVKFKIKPYKTFVLHDVIKTRIEMDTLDTDDEKRETKDTEVIIADDSTAETQKLYISLETLGKGENDIAKFISKSLSESLVFCNDRWFLYDKLLGIWRVIKTPSATVISNIQNHIDETKVSLLLQKMATDDEEQKKTLTECEKKYNEFYKQVGKGAFTNQIIKILQDYLFDGDFERQLDTTPYEVAFRNGIYNLKAKTITNVDGKMQNVEVGFRFGLKASDKLTQTIPFNYVKSTVTEVDEVKQELKKIANNNDQHLDYYLSSLGYAMTGDASLEQILNNIRGQKASNGKSVVFDALMVIMPNYIVELEKDLFDVNFGQIHKSVAGWKGKRIGYINELSKRRQDSDLLKKVADGTSIPYKVMYGTMDTMPITFKLFIVGNHTIKVEADGGIKRRLKMMQLDSDFVEGLEKDEPEKAGLF
jgi:phage/plasmid-associated DNA primase